ncbi:MAG: phosphoserine transaminase [Holosporaceae bacterium]|jgi:phosphoserine aminotransferase|nr:phosphoserine transaminase [Holosporaceae bacterium]
MQKWKNVSFSSGPCAKYPQWESPNGILVGRSHRSVDGLALLEEVLDLQRKILRIPDDYHVGIVGASSTGAVETLLWSLLGANGIDIISHCVFSRHWERDIVEELKLQDVRVFREDFPKMADVRDINFDRDVVFCWTSTTSGTSFRNTDWISADRKGLTICDAASAAFMFDFDWNRLDATAFSWQKGLGGEAGLGTIVLSPRAMARLKSHQPPWPIPRIFRIADDKKVNSGIFKGYTINTPSMLCIEDFRNALLWAEQIGGLAALIQRVEDNYAVVCDWISRSYCCKFLVDEKYRAHHVACLDLTSEKYRKLPETDKWEFLEKIVRFCELKKIGFDFRGHILTKPHLRIWCGPTIEASRLKSFLQNLEDVCSEFIRELDGVGKNITDAFRN